MARVTDQKIAFIQKMKELSKNLSKQYADIQQAKKNETEVKILTLAANMEKDNEITYSLLEEIIHSLNQLYDNVPTAGKIKSAKIESIDSSSSITLTSEQLQELEERQKRANMIYG